MCLTAQDRRREPQAQFASEDRRNSTFIDRAMPTGDSLGVFGAGLPSFIGGPMRLGEAVIGPAVATAMRANPGLVKNVGGKPMMSKEGALFAFSGLRGNKDPNAQGMTPQDAYKALQTAPAWQGDIPFYKDQATVPPAAISPAAEALIAPLVQQQSSWITRAMNRGEVIDRSGGIDSRGGGNRTFGSGGASGYGGRDRTAVGPGGRLGHI